MNKETPIQAFFLLDKYKLFITELLEIRIAGR